MVFAICRTTGLNRLARVGYQERDRHIIDYQLYELDGVRPYPGRGRFRGPRIGPGPYVACIGAAQTFGPFTERPFPRILADMTGIQTLNLGSGGAGPTFHRCNAAIMEYVNRAECAVVQVLSGRSASNRLFRVTEHGMHGFSELHGTEVSAAEFWEELIRSHEPLVSNLVTETRENYVVGMSSLLRAIFVPTVLLWLSVRAPHYEERNELPLWKLWGAFPQFVNRSMLNKLVPDSDAYVEVISSRGLPQQLFDRDGHPTTITYCYSKLSSEPVVVAENAYYPSPEMHEDAARALAATVTQLLTRPNHHAL